MKIPLILLGLLLTSAALSAQSRATGRVYHDVNGNGRYDAGEAGVAGVAVCNGVEVTVTDAEGHYELPVGTDNILFVIKPSGWAVPLNELNEPRFYYIHKPNGSPKLKFGGVDPTGPLPAAVDFALVPHAEPERFTALIFGDPQPLNEREVDYFSRGIVAGVRGIQGVALGISLGDLVWDRLDLFKSYREVIGGIGIPWYNVIGNHDMNVDAPADEVADETYEASFGPTNYAFNQGQAHFIVLDDILRPDPRGPGGEGFWGGFRPDQLDFIANDLKFVSRDKLIVLSMHIPLRYRTQNIFRDADRRRLFELLKDYPHVLVLSAHTHTMQQNFYGPADGWNGAKPLHEFDAGATCGDWHSGELDPAGLPPSLMRDGTPKGYSFLRVDGNRYVIDYQVAGQPADVQLSLFHPQVVARGRRTLAGIYANFFMGCTGNVVECRIDDGAWGPMKQVEEMDPTFVAHVYRWDTSDHLLVGRRPSQPAFSPHLWRTAIPIDLPAGEHRIEVRATDMFGRTFTRKSSYRLAEPTWPGPSPAPVSSTR